MLVGVVPTAAAEITASLKVAEVQDVGTAPYSTAELRLANAAQVAVETVLLRPAGGGPVVRHALAAAPGQEAETPVPLPAISPVQRYQVTALSGAGEVLGVAWAEITWPPERVATDVFLDDAYALWRDARADWPRRTRRNAILLLAIFATAAAAALVIRRPAGRVVALAGLIAAAAALAFIVPAWPDPVEATEYHLEIRRGPGHVKTDSFTTLAARRTARVLRRSPAVPYPVYPDLAAAAAAARVDPAAGTIELTVPCGGVRILRPAAAMPQAGALPAAGDLTVRTEGGTPTVAGEFPFPSRFVLRDDSVWSIPGRSGAVRVPLVPEPTARIRQILSPPGRGRLTRQHLRLLRYWQGKYQRADKLYVLGFARLGSHFRMVVVELPVPAAATRPASAPATVAPPAGASPPQGRPRSP